MLNREQVTAPVAYSWVENDQQLVSCCQMAQQASLIALDSEFIRTRTFYPRLGLIQLYDGVTLSLIDPMAISDWQPLSALLQAPCIEKILHASGEDIALLQHHLGVLVTPLLDTQILAAFIGEPLSSSFRHLVERYLQITLDKNQQRTNWLARPLNAQQLQYAAADVYYLLPLAKALLPRVAAANWLEAARDECHLLLQQRTKVTDPAKLYRQMAHSWRLSPRSLACLKQLAEWRFAEASAHDLALNFVVRESDLWQVARNLPSSLRALQQLDIEPRVVRHYGPHLLAMVAAVQQLAVESLPPKVNRLIDQADYKDAVIAIKRLIDVVAVQSGLSQSLLASQRQINRLLAWHWQHGRSPTAALLPPLLSGWRAALFGERLLALLAAY